MLKYIIATKINIKGIELNNRIFFVSSNPSTTKNKPGNTINTIENNILNNIVSEINRKCYQDFEDFLYDVLLK